MFDKYIRDTLETVAREMDMVCEVVVLNTRSYLYRGQGPDDTTPDENLAWSDKIHGKSFTYSRDELGRLQRMDGWISEYLARVDTYPGAAGMTITTTTAAYSQYNGLVCLLAYVDHLLSDAGESLKDSLKASMMENGLKVLAESNSGNVEHWRRSPLQILEAFHQAHRIKSWSGSTSVSHANLDQLKFWS